MAKDLAEYTMDERMQIDKSARRNVRAESMTILTAGFGLIMIFTFFFGQYTFLPVAEFVGIRPTVVWAAMSFIGAALWSWCHYRLFEPKVAWAQKMSAAFLHQHQEDKRIEREAKIEKMRGQ